MANDMKNENCQTFGTTNPFFDTQSISPLDKKKYKKKNKQTSKNKNKIAPQIKLKRQLKRLQHIHEPKDR